MLEIIHMKTNICTFRLHEMSSHERGEQGSSEDAGEGLALKAQLAAKEAEVATLVVDLQKASKATTEEEARRHRRPTQPIGEWPSEAFSNRGRGRRNRGAASAEAGGAWLQCGQD